MLGLSADLSRTLVLPTLAVALLAPWLGDVDAADRALPVAAAADLPVWSATIAPRYRLRADFEVPTDVVVGFADTSAEEATELVSAITPAAHVLILLAEETDAEAGTQWFMSLPPEVQRRSTLMTASQVDSLWIRDYGPLIATAGPSTRWLDAHYMFERPLDDSVPAWLGEWLGIEPLETSMSVDGGAVISDGQGRCISTLDYWTDGQSVDDEDTELVLHELGCRDLLLVPALRHDRTTHVDMFAQFVGPDRILVGKVDPDEDAEDARRMDEAARSIARWARDQDWPLEIVRVPTPVLGGERYYTYVNLLQLEDRVIVPHYPQITRVREKAIFAMLEAATGRPVVSVDVGELRELGGVVHCATLNLRLPDGAPWRR